MRAEMHAADRTVRVPCSARALCMPFMHVRAMYATSQMLSVMNSFWSCPQVAVQQHNGNPDQQWQGALL